MWGGGSLIAGASGSEGPVVGVAGVGDLEHRTPLQKLNPSGLLRPCMCAV